MVISNETYFLTEYVAWLTSSLIHGGISLSLHCELNNWHNNNYFKCVIGARQSVDSGIQEHPRKLEKRRSQSERLHREAVLKYALEGMFMDLGINFTLMPRHSSYEDIGLVEGKLFSSMDEIISVVRNYASIAVRVRWFEQHHCT